MYRIDDPTASVTLPTPEAALTEGYWTEGNPGTGTPATLERASWFNMIQEELRAIVVAGGLTPSKTTYNQILTAIRAMTADGSRVSGLVGKNNATTPNTQFDLSASSVTLRSPATGATAVVTNTGTITNNVLTAGPAANGRDQSAAFTASQWIYFYFIWNPTTSTLATISSAATPAVGPALPAGYTAWAFIGSVYFSASSALLQGFFRGSWFQYNAAAPVLVSGNATTLTSVSTTLLVPPDALQMELSCPNFAVTSQSGGLWSITCTVVVTGTAIAYQFGTQGGGSASTVVGVAGGSKRFPNIGQNFAYQITLGAGAGVIVSFNVCGYSVANGGE